MILASLLEGGNDAAVALSAPGRVSLSRGGLRQQVADTAATLNRAGIARGDRVAICLPDGPEMAAAFLGVASAAIAAPLNTRFTAAEFDFYISDLSPTALLALAGDDTPAVLAARRQGVPVIALDPLTDQAVGRFRLTGHVGIERMGNVADPQDCALLLHTSGTTARPKLVPLTHRKLCLSAGNVAASLQLTPADLGLHIMPLFHIHGLVAGLLAPLQAGGGVYCTPGLDLQYFKDWLVEAKPSWITAVPTMLQAIRDWAVREPSAARNSGLRVIRSCSAALPPSVARALEEAFSVPVLEAYAMTEAAHQISSNPLPPAERKFGSVGLAAGPRVAVLDSAGHVLPSGETGEVAIRGETVFDGYQDNPAANADAFVDGWFRTGDLGVMDDGYLWLKGRLKEMINRGGEKLSPLEIENMLLTHPAVSHAVVFAVPHPTLGEEAGAAVVLRDGLTATPDMLRDFVLTQLSLPKVPRRIVFLPELPKGPTGKLRRIGLAQTLGIASPDRPARVPARSPMERELADIWQGALMIDDIGVTDDFFDLGGNSIGALRIAAEVLARWGVEIALSQFLGAPTIADLALTIVERRLRGLEPDTLVRLLAEAEGAKAAGL